MWNNLGGWCNGSIAISKIVGLGPSPRPPASEKTITTSLKQKIILVKICLYSVVIKQYWTTEEFAAVAESGWMRFPAKEVAPFWGSKVRILPAAFSQEENKNAGFRNRNKSVGEQHIKLSCNPDG